MNKLVPVGPEEDTDAQDKIWSDTRRGAAELLERWDVCLYLAMDEQSNVLSQEHTPFFGAGKLVELLSVVSFLRTADFMPPQKLLTCAVRQSRSHSPSTCSTDSCGCNQHGSRAGAGGAADRERGAGVCNECGLTHRGRVFSIGDSDWWAAAGTAEEILAACMKENGCTHEEATGEENELPQELSLMDLHRTKFQANERGILIRRKTFFETLNGMVKSGAKFPCAFACMQP